ncbi:hypothetical protein M378DRAFT_8493 [Amanita muscaria Koide BX008]|uniref:DUF1688-domain-containing protein n=1 Tax=Amanita muscaria (strain Koide BX008) TaxID=946122 RepID=A0A0C2TMK7_AMAMK|nr:hypothetical protein M378DRAFT_8493 [Amanita muscaria Koide BX008]
MTTADYLRTLPAIRERCSRVFELAKADRLQYITYKPEKEADVVDFCISLLKRDYGSDLTAIPPHGRRCHLDAGLPRVDPLLEKWENVDVKEKARRLVDLTVISVLLDAGAGNVWKYSEASSGKVFSRSEGLAIASFHMFQEGLFSGDTNQPHQADANGLRAITIEKVQKAMQVDEDNPMAGVEGRTGLLYSLSTALELNPEYFGSPPRPGHMIDFLERQSSTSEDGTTVVPAAALWTVLLEGFNHIWPSRINFQGKALGDVWPCPALKEVSGGQEEGDDLVPFHKLSQWLAYSLIEALERTLNWRFEGKEHMTGLPEYRNGGLFVDFGVLELKPNLLPMDPKSGLPHALPSHPAIVEWRALTVIGLDRVAAAIRQKLGLTEKQLSLLQILEGATWKGGREKAKMCRPSSGGPPIEIESDGTVF